MQILNPGGQQFNPGTFWGGITLIIFDNGGNGVIGDGWD